MCNDGKDNNGDGKVDAEDPTCYKMVALTSSKCTEPYCNEKFLKDMFNWYSIDIVDYSTGEWKRIYTQLNEIYSWKQMLPTFLFNKKKKYLNLMSKELLKTINLSWYKYQINL